MAALDSRLRGNDGFKTSELSLAPNRSLDDSTSIDIRHARESGHPAVSLGPAPELVEGRGGDDCL
jgi:hypothetical protein